ncbi:MAG: UDP-N-acetylglucosamine--N-acetylmuramyl-(pentapeptide) pyrophosphoryl-undecaprenol N-acetylglucosamine transferase [Treponema sp.]|nr:UDP-N-acetylglucosamine--N-acetylmuramyl-(pentapeptide) pyrophosphoryl-undecaprenol N-acetylglucosamine transferase [Treponema sp.]
MTEIKMIFAFTGGGTGGHIYPGLAVAQRLKNLLPCRIFWIGSSEGMDRSIVEEAGLEFYGIPSGKLRRYFSLRNVSDIFKVAAGFFAARRILKKEKPVLLFSKGGFVSVPPSAAASSLKIPVYSHESDLTPGLATRINLRFSEKIFIPYKESKSFYSEAIHYKLEISGNPVRMEFHSADSSKGRAFLNVKEGERILLVLGGSSGSLEINRIIKECLPQLTRHYTVVHQCGSNEGVIPEICENYKPYAYLRDELPHIISAAELIVCRGGAGTIWECAALKKPMVIIPLRASGTSRGDQVENARVFEEAGAAINFHNDGDSGNSENLSLSAMAEKLSSLVSGLAADEEKRRSMAASAIGGIIAAEYIAKAVAQRVG